MGILDHIQTKDKQKRAQLSVAIAGGVTGIIALIWISTLPARFGDQIALDNIDADAETQSESEVQEEKSVGSIISDTKSQLGSLIESNKEILKNAKEELREDSSLQQLTEQGAPVTEGGAEVSGAPITDSTAVTLSPDPTTTAYVPESTTTPSVPTPEVAPTPRVILIGTTTRQ